MLRAEGAAACRPPVAGAGNHGPNNRISNESFAAGGRCRDSRRGKEAAPGDQTGPSVRTRIEILGPLLLAGRASAVAMAAAWRHACGPGLRREMNSAHADTLTRSLGLAAHLLPSRLPSLPPSESLPPSLSFLLSPLPLSLSLSLSLSVSHSESLSLFLRLFLSLNLCLSLFI